MNSNREVLFNESDILLSTTDNSSHIKYANEKFCKIAGFTFAELEGKSHNVVRHPDMPKAAFNDLWSYIQQGDSWMGPVKNRCKNGDYYWVNAYVTPIKDSTGRVIEYQSVRTKLDEDVKVRAEKVYAKLSQDETPSVLKYSTDLTFWFQATFILLSIFSLYLISLTDLSMLVTGIFLFISALATVSFINWRKKYQQLVNDAKQIFDNDLMSYMYSGSNDAVSNIHLALKMRTAEISAITGRVNDVSLHVSDRANETSVASQTVAAQLTEQKTEIDHVSIAMREMSSTVNDITRIVVEAAQASEQGRNISQGGQKIVTNTVSAIRDLSIQLDEVNTIITTLIESISSIGGVLSEISSIADQTNLLALNAAIEAARAGEQGRGFAVVAEEVRALALRTQQSTEEINNQLRQLQSDSSNAVIAMKKGNELSRNCVHLSEQTGEALGQIHSEVSHISDLNMQISTAVEEQSVVTEQISKNVDRISELSVVCEEQGQQSTVLVADLLAQLNEQKSLIMQFKHK